jgi:hypothetical protein
MAEYFAMNPHADANDVGEQRAAQRHAFRCFLQEFPEYGILLIDTVSLEFGLEDAIIVLKEFNPQHYGLRIDSGDLGTGTIWCRQQLQEAGLSHITIALSGGLRAANLYSLVQQGVPFNSAGIGEYFQFGGERQRRPEDLYEAPVNAEIVTKAGHAQAPDGQGFILAKMSETLGKTSHSGVLDRWRLLDAGGQLLADVEVDLLKTGEAVDTLPTDLTSLRLDTFKPKTFKARTHLVRPIVPLLRGPELINPDQLTDKASHQRFVDASNHLPDNFKRVDGSHTGCPVGIERLHYLKCDAMRTGQQVVARL